MNRSFSRTVFIFLKRSFSIRIREENEFIIYGPKPLSSIPKTSLGQIVLNGLFENVPKGEAMVDATTKKAITYKEIISKSIALANVFRKCGYGRHTKFTLCSENHLNFIIPVLSCMYIGATIALVNPMYSKIELLHCFNITKPDVVFTSKFVYPKLLELEEEMKYVKYMLFTDGNGYGSINKLITISNSFSDEKFELTQVDPCKDVVFIYYSSGTTGIPKGVMVTHANMFVEFLSFLDPFFFDQDTTRPSLCMFPLCHSYGLTVNLFNVIKGHKIVLVKDFAEKFLLDIIEHYKIGTLWAAPAICRILARSMVHKNYNLHSVSDVNSSGSYLSKHIEAKLKDIFPKVGKVRQSYGLTECSANVLMNPLNKPKSGSCGKVIPYMSCKVLDLETGKSLGPNQTGELCFRGGLVTKGYYNNKEASRNMFTSDGWLRTGDLGYYDEEEYFFYVDRVKDIMKYHNFQVSPAMIESILMDHPEVVDAGVVGIPIENEDNSVVPLAFVVKTSDAQLTAKEIIKFANDRLPRFMKLRGGVRFVQKIPRSSMGKILRSELKNMLKGNLSN